MSKRKFKGVWIPREIWLNEDLSITEKAFMAEIDSFSEGKLGCFASNNHFAKFSNLSPSRCSSIINDLHKRGYLTVVLHRAKDSKKIVKRNIIITNPDVWKVKEGVSETEKGISETKGGYFGNSEGTNTKYTNTSNTNTSTKPLSSSKNEQDDIPYQEIIAYLNEKTNKPRGFIVNEPRKRNIRARFKEGYELEDFKQVIDVKVNHWLNDDKMKKHLNPETLFAVKHFDKYLNQDMKPANQPKQEQENYLGIEEI